MTATLVDILVSPLGLALIGYVGVVLVLAAAVHPVRMHMVDTANEMLDEGHWNAAERAKINHLLDTCMSFRVGVLLVVAAADVILDIILHREVESPSSASRLRKDPRFHTMIRCFFLSVMAVNPLAFLVMQPLAVAFVVLEALRGRVAPRELVEEPAIRASAAVACGR